MADASAKEKWAARRNKKGDAPTQIAEADDAAPAPPPPKTGLARVLPEGLRFPWWVVLVASAYFLLKLMLTLEHPCYIIGARSPVTRAQITKRHREVSMCTHPDRLVGRGAVDVRRGELLFQRASAAKDELLGAVRQAAAAREAESALAGEAGDAPVEVTCSTLLDAAIYEVFAMVADRLSETGAFEVGGTAYKFVVDIVTLEYDIGTSISLLLLLMALGRFVLSFLGFLKESGPLTTLASVATTLVVGPLPTVARFVTLPALRLEAFVRDDLLPLLDRAGALAAGDDEEEEHGDDDGGGVSDDDGGANGGDGDAANGDAADATTEEVSASVAAAREKMKQRGGGEGARQRGGRRAASSKPTSPNAKPAAAAAAAQPQAAEPIQYSFPPEGVVGELGAREVLSRRPPPNGRVMSSHAIQFDLLLSTTKGVIPLITLVLTGQVYNGLVFAVVTAQLLQRVPVFRPEMHHAYLVVAGLLHTFVCSSKLPSDTSADALVLLQWDWSSRDILAVTNVISLGASYASFAGAGNEPLFASSFAAGVGLRLLLQELLPASVGAQAGELLRTRLHLGLSGVDEVSARAAAGVGSCGGGPLRALLGWAGGAAAAKWAGLLAKLVLIWLPALAAAQWGARLYGLSARLAAAPPKKRVKITGELLTRVLRKRLAASAFVFGSLALLVGLLCAYELNAVNASLGNFLVVALVGCLFESLLATYDVRGRVRQVFFFVIFMFL